VGGVRDGRGMVVVVRFGMDRGIVEVHFGLGLEGLA
jgi:hypothetical protein